MEFVKSVIERTYKPGDVFSEEDLLGFLPRDYKISTLRWDLYHLCEKRYLTKIGKKKYSVGKRIKFSYEIFDNKINDVIKYISKTFPRVEFNIWYTTLLNKWFNLLLGVNYFIIEFDKEISGFMFDEIKEIYDGVVLFNPTINELNLFGRNNCLIVKNKFSKSPKNKEFKYNIAIEKLCVDLFTDKLLKNLFDEKEVITAFNNVMKNYEFDINTMLSYAERRNAKDFILYLLKENENDFIEKLFTRFYS